MGAMRHAAGGLLTVAVLLLLGVTARAGDAPKRESEKADCCRRESDEISRWQENADRLYARFKPREAASELQKILQLDRDNFEALVKLSRAYIDIGDQIPQSSAEWKEQRLRAYSEAEDYARRAVKADAGSAWGYVWMAASLGKIAVLSPVGEQLDLAGEIRDTVEKAIARDPQNGLAYHIYGVWQRKVAELGQGRRVLASVIYGRSVPEGSLQKSIEYLKKAVALNPSVIVSRLELARSYIAAENWPQARAMLRSVQELPIQFSDDAKHKEQSAQLLAQIN